MAKLQEKNMFNTLDDKVTPAVLHFIQDLPVLSQSE